MASIPVFTERPELDQLIENLVLFNQIGTEIDKGNKSAAENLEYILQAIDENGRTLLLDWKKKCDLHQSELIILSIGSAHDKASSQQEPPFATLSNKKFSILNVDPSFQSKQMMLSHNINVDYLPMQISESSIKGRGSPNTAKTLQEIIIRQLKKNKSIIFMYHTRPGSYLSFSNLFNAVEDYLNESIYVLGCYQGRQPVLVYSKDAIIKLSQEGETNPIARQFWKLFDDIFTDELGDEDCLNLNNDIPLLQTKKAILYQDLNSLTLDDIFLMRSKDVHIDSSDKKTEIMVYAINKMYELLLADKLVAIAIRCIDDSSLNPNEHFTPEVAEIILDARNKIDSLNVVNKKPSR